MTLIKKKEKKMNNTLSNLILINLLTYFITKILTLILVSYKNRWCQLVRSWTTKYASLS